MALAPGSKLGPYEIVAPIGRGGMGEVYRALDSRLNREVAIKVSAERFNDRFEREARAVAALNHNNICTLHDVGPNYLVMELIEGATLAERIKQSPVPIDEALKIASQIAGALDAAHTRGIVHRDLKPGNIKIKPDGSVKVLDFGLAKIGGTSTPAIAVGEDSPTLTMPFGATEAGVILGTASYMAPEQAKGKPVDKRCDIWAFGVVLYEMLTGTRPFQGEDLTETLASVVRDKPDLDKVPAEARQLVEACLQKDPAKRLRDIADAMRLIGGRDVQPATGLQPSSPRIWQSAAALATLALAALALLHFRETAPPEPSLIQTDLALPNGVSLPPAGNKSFAFSPDGTRLAFNGISEDGQSRIWIRNMQSGSTVEVPGTERAHGSIAWTSDGKWMTFEVEGRVMKMESSGGTLTAMATGTWISWGLGDVGLLRTTNLPIQRISISSGSPQPLLQFDSKSGETAQRPYMVFLPGGNRFLYGSTQLTRNVIRVASLDGGVTKDLPHFPNTSMEFVPRTPGSHDGWLIYVNQGQLVARALNSDSLEFTGSEQVLASDVPSGFIWATSGTNLLAYERGDAGQRELAWYSRGGKRLSTVAEGVISFPRLSPDQTVIAFGRDQRVFLHDTNRNLTRQLWGSRAGRPIWTPDGKFLIIDTVVNGKRQAIERPADGSASEKLVFERSDAFAAGVNDVSRDGRWQFMLDGRGVMSFLSRPDGKRVPFQENISGPAGRFSPDGKWVLVSTDAGTRREIFALGVPAEAGGTPGASGRIQISAEGGVQPLWSANGKEIYYIAPDMRMMAVPVDLKEPTLKPGIPKPLFQTRLAGTGDLYYDVTTDGQRFLIAQSSPDGAPPPLTLLLNWGTQLK